MWLKGRWADESSADAKCKTPPTPEKSGGERPHLGNCSIANIFPPFSKGKIPFFPNLTKEVWEDIAKLA